MSVKAAIVELCKLLKLTTEPIIVSPEDFRLAKLNSTKSRGVMLRVLTAVLKIADSSCKLGSITAVHNLLRKMKYPRIKELSMSEENVSSQELLMCVAWSLHCTRLLARMADEALRPVDPYLVYEEKTFSTPTADQQKHATEFHKLDPADQISFIALLVKQIEQRCDRLLNLKMETNSLEIKIGEEVAGKIAAGDMSCLSQTQRVFLLKHPRLVEEVIRRMKRKCQILKTYSKWKQYDAKFWNWLVRVCYFLLVGLTVFFKY